MASGLMAAMARPHALGGMGIFGGGMYASHQALVIDHEIVGFIWRLVDGLRIDEDCLGVAVVKQSADNAGFVTHPHTLAHLRAGEYWQPCLSDSLGFDEWLAQGKISAFKRANQMAKEILTSHAVPALPLQVGLQLQAVLTEAERALRSANE